jgi:hypothetical protein
MGCSLFSFAKEKNQKKALGEALFRHMLSSNYYALCPAVSQDDGGKNFTVLLLVGLIWKWGFHSGGIPT